MIRGLPLIALAALPSAGSAQPASPASAHAIECQLVDCSNEPSADEAEQSFSLVRGNLAKKPSQAGKSRSAKPGAPAVGRLDMRLTFTSGSADLAPDMAARAKTFAQALQGPYASRARFTIEGHTDSVGSRASNRDLSRRRAQAVVDFLVGEGVAADRLEAIGYGFDRPRRGAEAADPANRRVEIVRRD